MNTKPTTWWGYSDPTLPGASGGFPAALFGTEPAVCVSLDDLPSSTGAGPTGTPDSSHEWNVAKFRKLNLCDNTGAVSVAWVLMTDPVDAQSASGW